MEITTDYLLKNSLKITALTKIVHLNAFVNCPFKMGESRREIEKTARMIKRDITEFHNVREQLKGYSNWEPELDEAYQRALKKGGMDRKESNDLYKRLDYLNLIN